MKEIPSQNSSPLCSPPCETCPLGPHFSQVVQPVILTTTSAPLMERRYNIRSNYERSYFR